MLKTGQEQLFYLRCV